MRNRRRGTITLDVPKPQSITVVCAWCGTCMQAGGPKVSHGMCKACAAEFLAAL